MNKSSLLQIREEALACREHVAVFNMSYFGKFYLHGPDAQKAADWICSNNVNRPEGSTVYTCMLNKDGGVEADLTFSVLRGGTGRTPADPAFSGPGFYIAAGGGSATHAWTHIKQVRLEILAQSSHAEWMGRSTLCSVKRFIMIPSFSDHRRPEVPVPLTRPFE